MNAQSLALFNRFTVKAKFRHMLVLIRLNELGSMKRASEALGISQPAVSMMLSEMEKLLGVQLFLRHARGVEPTRIALELMPVAKRVVAAIGDGAEIIANALSESEGFVRVAASPAAMGGLLHPFVPGFTRKYPRIHVEIDETTLSNPLELIAEDACDLLCSREPPVIPEDWSFQPCSDDRLIVICGNRHPFAGRGTATLEELGAQNWLLTRTASIARRHFETVAQANDWPMQLRSGIVTHTPALTLELLASGNFITLIPHSVALPWISSGWARAIDSDATLQLPPLGFLQRQSGMNRATRTLASEMTTQFGRGRT